MKRYLYTHCVIVKAQVLAEDEEEAKCLVQDRLLLGATRTVPLIGLEPLKGDVAQVYEITHLAERSG